MTSSVKRICVYCGAASGNRATYLDSARRTGRLIAERGLELVYGGGHVGMMGALADAALGAGGRVVGIIPKALIDKELGHRGVSELRVVADMHERKHMMADMADAFITLPGGWGTLEELTEMLTWSQLGFHQKRIAIIDIEGYYDQFFAFARHMEAEGFLRQGTGPLYQSARTPEEALAMLCAPELS